MHSPEMHQFSSEQQKGANSIQYHLTNAHSVFANKMSSIEAFRQESSNPDWFGRNDSMLPSENTSLKGIRTTAVEYLDLSQPSLDSAGPRLQDEMDSLLLPLFIVWLHRG